MSGTEVMQQEQTKGTPVCSQASMEQRQRERASADSVTGQGKVKVVLLFKMNVALRFLRFEYHRNSNFSKDATGVEIHAQQRVEVTNCLVSSKCLQKISFRHGLHKAPTTSAKDMKRRAWKPSDRL